APPRERDAFRDAGFTVVDDAGVPDQAQTRVACALEVLETNRVGRPGRPGHVRGSPAERLLGPVVDDERSVKKQPVAIVAFDADAMNGFSGRDDRPGPPHRVPIEWNAPARRIQRPPEFDTRIVAREPWGSLEAVVVVVLAGDTQ